MIYIVALFIAVAAVVAVTYPLWGRKDRSVETEPEQEGDDVRFRREKLYEAIRELDSEREAGSLSQEEYEKSRVAYEMQAARLLQEEERHEKRRPGPGRRPARAQAATVGSPPLSHRFGLLIPAAVILLVGVGIGFFLGTALQPREEGMEITGTVPGGGQAAGPPTTLQEANAALDRGDFRRALEGYKHILDRDPENLAARTQIGVLLARGEHYDEAIRTFDRVLTQQPNYPHALFEKGLVLFQGMGEPREGVKIWEQLIQTAPPENEYAVIARRLLAQVRESMGGSLPELPVQSSDK